MGRRNFGTLPPSLGNFLATALVIYSTPYIDNLFHLPAVFDNREKLESFGDCRLRGIRGTGR